MTGLQFTTQAPPVTSNPYRADVVCFVGFVKRRATPVPAPIERWLYEHGWLTVVNGALVYLRSSAAELLDLPIPIDTWDAFDTLFAWSERGERQITYLGAAVRSFFAQGGRKCYVVRVGDPEVYGAPRNTRLAQIARLLPGYPGVLDVNPVERESWRGVGHLYGLPDVSFICLPDLPELVAVEKETIEQEEQVFPFREQFVECSANEPDVVIEASAADVLRAPRCDEQGYADWSLAINFVADMLARRLPEVHFVGALPIPANNSLPGRDLLRYLTRSVNAPMSAAPNNSRNGIASAFVQLGYPWLQTRGAELLPEGLEPPDAVLAGMLARNALTRGTFRVVAQERPADVSAVYPPLGRDQLYRPYPDSPTSGRSHSLLERISLFGQTPTGMALLSDVTTSLNESYRPASVSRLVSAIIRAARLIGEDTVFEPSSETLWGDLRARLETLMLALLEVGALRGRTAAEAFEVRCDRTTMSQNDIDNGRVIARIQFEAAIPIDTMTVVLAMNEGGQISLIVPQEAL